MTTKTRTLTVADLDKAQQDERWLGWGYLGERQRCEDPAAVTAADTRLIQWANSYGWTYERLFQWANSKNGRWYGDAMFGGSGDPDKNFTVALSWRVL